MFMLRFPHRQVRRANTGILVGLLLACAPTLLLNAQQPGTAIVFEAQPQISEEFWPALLESVRADLAADPAELPEGVALDERPTFFRGLDLAKGIDFSQVIQVRLLGRCDVLPQADRPTLKGALGWVPMVSGVIQPFIFIDCARIAQDLRPALVGLSKERRRHAMNQAIAHVLIHEWIHIATQSRSHGAHGITQAALSVDELIADPKKSRLLIAAHKPPE
jgi:hypothetical protein